MEKDEKAPLSGSHLDRMRVELSELDEKTDKLASFMETDVYRGLNTDRRHLMCDQHGAMAQYRGILARRIEVEVELGPE